MPRFGMASVIVRELTAVTAMEREPEQTLVMRADDQVDAYAEAGRIAGGMAAVYLFHAAHVSRVIVGSRTIVDLACGPGTLLAQIASLNPKSHFTGVDLSEEMLTSAREHVSRTRLANVDFRIGDVTRLNWIADHSVDGVISTMALHHLPTAEALKQCFKEINRILKPAGALYLADFTRVKSDKTVQYISYMNRKYQDDLFSLDTERSMRAAFLLSDFARLADQELLISLRIQTTFLVPLFVIIKTPDRSRRDDLQKQLTAMRRTLPRRFRRDLDDMRLFFKLGGLEGDPFFADARWARVFRGRGADRRPNHLAPN